MEPIHKVGVCNAQRGTIRVIVDLVLIFLKKLGAGGHDLRHISVIPACLHLAVNARRKRSQESCHLDLVLLAIGEQRFQLTERVRVDMLPPLKTVISVFDPVHRIRKEALRLRVCLPVYVPIIIASIEKKAHILDSSVEPDILGVIA